MTWVLLVPAPASRLVELVNEHWEERFRGHEQHFARWEVLDCGGRYAAVLDRNPGSERGLDLPLIAYLAPEARGPIYLMYMHEDYAGANVIEEYEGGSKRRSLPGDPYDFARRLGCPVPGEKAPVVAAPSAAGVVFVEGVSADSAARALSVDPRDPGVPLRFEDTDGGALIYNRQTPDAPLVAAALSKALPGVNVYTVVSGPEAGRFLVLLTRGGKTAGSFSLPAGTAAAGLFPVPKLDSVKGQSTPEGIVKALGIPSDLLQRGGRQ